MCVRARLAETNLCVCCAVLTIDKDLLQLLLCLVCEPVFGAQVSNHGRFACSPSVRGNLRQLLLGFAARGERSGEVWLVASLLHTYDRMGLLAESRKIISSWPSTLLTTQATHWCVLTWEWVVLGGRGVQRERLKREREVERRRGEVRRAREVKRAMKSEVRREMLRERGQQVERERL